MIVDHITEANHSSVKERIHLYSEHIEMKSSACDFGDE
jgi:hypothetical protein